MKKIAKIISTALAMIMIFTMINPISAQAAKKTKHYLLVEEKTTEYEGNEEYSHTTQKYTYNKKGQLVRRKDYTSDNLLWTKTTYKYNSKGQLIKEREDSNGGDYETTFTYNKKGRLVKTVCKEVGFYYSKISKYDAHSNLVRVRSKYAEGAYEVKKIKNKYDKKGNLKSAEMKSSTGGYYYYKYYTSGKNKGKLKYSTYSNTWKSDKSGSKYKYSYDKHGNLSKMEIRDNVTGELTESTVYKYKTFVY